MHGKDRGSITGRGDQTMMDSVVRQEKDCALVAESGAGAIHDAGRSGEGVDT